MDDNGMIVDFVRAFGPEVSFYIFTCGLIGLGIGCMAGYLTRGFCINNNPKMEDDE